jgi:hypothetical protein
MTFISSGKPDMVFCQGSVRSSGGMNAANVGVRAAGERVRGVSLHMKVSGIAGRGLIARSETADRLARWSDTQQSTQQSTHSE